MCRGGAFRLEVFRGEGGGGGNCMGALVSGFNKRSKGRVCWYGREI